MKKLLLITLILFTLNACSLQEPQQAIEGGLKGPTVVMTKQELLITHEDYPEKIINIIKELRYHIPQGSFKILNVEYQDYEYGNSDTYTVTQYQVKLLEEISNLELLITYNEDGYTMRSLFSSFDSEEITDRKLAADVYTDVVLYLFPGIRDIENYDYDTSKIKHYIETSFDTYNSKTKQHFKFGHWEFAYFLDYAHTTDRDVIETEQTNSKK